MKILPTEIADVWILEAEAFRDARGFFARTICEREFRDLGLPERRWVQCATSQNQARGTLRGLHFQAAPHSEAKLIRCTMGRIFDVAVDLRPDSPTLGRWIGVELSRSNLRSLLIPEGCAHGYQALEDDSEVLYMISAFYFPEAARGIRWDDPALGIAWPLPDPILSERDRRWPLLGNAGDPIALTQAIAGLWAPGFIPGDAQ